MAAVFVLLHRPKQLHGTLPLTKHLVIDLYVVSGFAGLYRLAICYMIFLRERILAEKEEALMILGTSYSRKLPICWPQLITAS